MIAVPEFHIVRRGYDQAEVDSKVGSLVETANKARTEADRLREQLSAHQHRITELETASTQRTDPSLTDIGDRSQRIFAMLDEEVSQIRANALAEADRMIQSAQREATETCQQADTYAATVRAQSEQEATQRLTDASAKAEEVIASADEASRAKANEAQAAYDQQRVRIATMAADFEQWLADRRDQSETEFTARVKEQEAAIAAAEQHRAMIESEAERYQQAQQAQADALLTEAQTQAKQIVKEADIQAEQIRRESDRDLEATMARKDAITSQMASLRQMLASTLTGGVPTLTSASAQVAAPAADLSDQAWLDAAAAVRGKTAAAADDVKAVKAHITDAKK